MSKGDKRNKKPLVLDLFSGCGGLSFGFEKAGFKIIAGVDNWKDSLVTFEKNHHDTKTILLDLGKFKPEEIANKVGNKIDVIIGGPPCQGFSISGKRNPDDPRNNLYRGFVKTVAYFKPEAFVLENVPNLVSMSGGEIKDQIIKDFSGLGYDVKYKILLASDYGVPQNRRRVVFVGVLGQNNFEYPQGTSLKNKQTCFDALCDLPENSIADGTVNNVKPKSDYQKLMRTKINKIYKKKAIEINPQHAIAYYNWGTALNNLGMFDKAIEKFEKATEIAPQIADYYSSWENMTRLSNHLRRL